MDNLLTDLGDLRIGDEIIVGGGSSSGGLLYLRVLQFPRLKKTGATTYYGTPLYRTVKCSLNVTEKTYSTTWNNNTRTYSRKIVVFTPEDHNTQRYFDLNYKSIYRVKKS